MNTLNTSCIRAITTEELQLIGVGGGIIGPDGCIRMPLRGDSLPDPFPIPFPGFPE